MSSSAVWRLSVWNWKSSPFMSIGFFCNRLVGVVSGLLCAATIAGCTGIQAPAPEVGNAEWVVEGGNAQRNRTVEAQAIPPLRQGQEYSIGGDTTYGSPAVVAQGLIIAEGDRKLHALALSDGAEQWQFPVIGSYLSPAIDGDRVFIRSERGEEGWLYAISLDGGKELWAYRFPLVGSSINNVGGHVTSPVAVGDRVFVGASQSIYAFDTEDGALMWETDLGTPIVTSAAVADDTIYVGDFTGLHALDANSGEEQWHYPVDGLGLYFAPVITGNHVIIAGESTIYSIDRTSGELMWERSFVDAQIIPAGAGDDAVYVKSATTLFAVDPLSGEDIWLYKGGDFVSLPAVTGKQLYVVVRTGGLAQIRGLNRLNGKEEWNMESTALSNAAPVVAGGYLFVRTIDGRILGLYSEEE